MNSLTDKLRLPLVSIATLFFIILGISQPGFSKEKDSGLINIQANEKLPGFNLPEFKTRQPYTYKSASGKPTLITFFSLSPTFRANRSLNLLDIQTKLNDTYGDRINSIALYSDDQNLNSLKEYIDDGLIKVKVLDDTKLSIYNRFGIYMMPIAILANQEGQLHAVIPYTNLLSELLNSNIKFLLGDITQNQLKNSLQPEANIIRSKEEKEYIRRVNYGRVMLSRKIYPAAIREFSTAAKIQPNAIEAVIGLGNVHLKAKNYSKAQTSFTKALSINKDSDEALSGLGVSLYKQGKISEALPILENALISEKPSFDVVISLADIYEQNGQIKKAMRLNKLAISKLIQKFD